MRSSRTFHILKSTRGSDPSQRTALGSSARGVVAGVALTGIAVGLIAGAAPAIASVGGGGIGGGAGGTGGAADSYALYARDLDLDPNTSGIQPEQGWGQASIDYFAAAMEAQGRWASTTDPNDSMDGTRRGINEACQIAIDAAIARSNGAADQARVVMVGANYSVLGGTPLFGWGDVGGRDRMASWFNAQTASNAWQPSMDGYDEASYGEIANVFIANIPADPQIVCVALNEQEPDIYAGYTLAITTDATDTFAIAGGDAAVFDTIHASNGGSSIVETVTADVILHWTGPDGATQQVTKQAQIVNNGDSTSPNFVPADFGWATWAEGDFWFDIQVAQQGGMDAPVDTPDRDPRESWSAWEPDPNKQVIGSSEESGDLAGAEINGLSVYPGQKLEYSVGVDLRVPADIQGKITSLAVVDSFDPQFTPDKASVEFWDSRNATNPRPVPRSAYTLTWDAEANSFTATFTPAWVQANVVDAPQQGWLSMRFTGTVKDTTAPGATVKNQAFQVVNGVSLPTEVPTVLIPGVQPDKEDLNTDLIDIDGKTVLEGDHILYRLTLDGGPARDQLAYNVHKLGMIDDFDEEYLDLDVADVKITAQSSGADVTSKFTIQIVDGVLYAFAKQVDSVDAYGEPLPGDPQPSDLKAYSAAAIDPLVTPIIDQSLLGEKYWITLKTLVTKTTDGYVIRNQAVQNIENSLLETKIVSNPLKDIDPSKDVVVSEQTGEDSINETEVALNGVFSYRLNSSVIPADRAYEAKNWSLRDTFDRVHDQYTGNWAVYASTDLYDGDTLLVEAGDLLQDSAGNGTADLFTVAWDEASYTLTVDATQKYLDLVNTRGDLEQAFSVYTQMIRIAPAEKVLNQTVENYNQVDRESNIVWTTTPENPAIDVEKYTLSEGLEAGDRDTDTTAYSIPTKELSAGTRVGIRVTNTGDVNLRNVTLTDRTHQGLAGDVRDITCTRGDVKLHPSIVGDLAIGESVDCEGVLTGVKAGQLHGDTVTATGESVHTGSKVSDEDPWFAKAAGGTAALAATGSDTIGLIAGSASAIALLIGGLMALIISRRRTTQSDASATN